MNRLLLSALAATTLLTGAAACAQAPAQPAPAPGGGHGFFDRMDTNKDGIVTRAEVTAILEKRFADLDTNHDGTISAAERQAQRDERWTERFNAMDTDKNGQLSPEELRARGGKGDKAADAGQKMGWGKHRGGFRKGPQGDTTKEQFMARSLRMFDMLDSNDDGQITAAERDAARDRMGRMGGGRRPAPQQD